MYYKIIKVFAARLKDVNLDLLSSQQPAYLRKRFIGESGRLLQIFTAWKVSKYRVISGPNAEKYGTEITPHLDTFHAVNLYWFYAKGEKECEGDWLRYLE